MLPSQKVDTTNAKLDKLSSFLKSNLNQQQKSPKSLLRFYKTKWKIHMGTVDPETKKVIMIDATDSKLKIIDDVKIENSNVQVGITWTIADYGTPLHVKKTNKGIVVFCNKNGDAKIYFLANINSTPLEVYSETGVNTNVYVREFPPAFYDDNLNSILMIGTYNKSDSSKKLCLSLDGGQTFNVVKTGKAVVPGTYNHWHAFAFDPYSGWLWASEGDVGNAGLHYSTDLGQTWTELNNSQPTAILPFPNCILFGRDAGVDVGFDVLVKPQTKDELSNIKNLFGEYKKVASKTGAGVRYVDSPIYEGIEGYCVLYNGMVEVNEPGFVFGTGDGGKSLHVVFSGVGAIEKGGVVRRFWGMDDQYLYGNISDGANDIIVYSKRVAWE